MLETPDTPERGVNPGVSPFGLYAGRNASGGLGGAARGALGSIRVGILEKTPERVNRSLTTGKHAIEIEVINQDSNKHKIH